MAGSTYGKLFSITTFGESHGVALGVVIDGCPSNLEIDLGFIQQELNRRKPGQSHITTQRDEDHSFEILSGVFEGITTGAPICIIVKNHDQKSQDYNELKEVYRPSHADYTYTEKYGIRDYRGGGRSSARETVARVLAGAIAKLFLKKQGIHIQAYVQQIGSISLNIPHQQLDLAETETNVVRCPHKETALAMIALVEKIGAEGDSVGGAVSCVVSGLFPGLGEPVFDKLHAELGKAMLSINACKGFEIGSGFDAITMLGSTHNDSFVAEDGKVSTVTNHSGGVQGGISNGSPVYFRCAFKPVATIRKQQSTINSFGAQVMLQASGRHDPCVVPRAVPIVEAMAAIVLLDLWLQHRAYSKVL
jgi:chorismate synthase